MSELWIPIVMFIMTGFAAVGYFFFNHKNRADIMNTVQKAMDTGSPITGDLLAKLGAAINPKIRDMRRGIVLLSIGIAGLMASMFFDDPEVLTGIRAGAVFPLMMGIGFLVVWRLNRDS